MKTCEIENAVVHHLKYRGKRLYVHVIYDKDDYITDIQFSGSEQDQTQWNTLSGLELISNLIGDVLKSGLGIQMILFSCATASIKKDDIAGHIHKCILRSLKGAEREEVLQQQQQKIH